MKFKCRACKNLLKKEVLDLGHQPPSNAYLRHEQLFTHEKTYPLKLYICESCWLAQLPEYAKAEDLFTNDYAYFSSTSSSWCKHAEKFVDLAKNKLSLNKQSFVVELASNDGYLLQYVKKRDIPCLGIEPTMAAAKVAKEKGIDTISKFFGSALAQEIIENSKFGLADLVVANNVVAHVPDINDFLKGIYTILKPSGTCSIEFPHILNLIKENQFDTIYHEHFSYFSLKVMRRIANEVGLFIEDVEEIPTHGGSLRVWFKKIKPLKISPIVEKILDCESKFQLDSLYCYQNFQERAFQVKLDFLSFLIQSKQKKLNIYGYGAAAKGNTLLNYLGVKNDLIKGIADKAKSKQGKFMPGSHIPIISIEELVKNKPDYIIVFPWNLISEIKAQLKGFKLITIMPKIKYWD